MHSSLAEAAGSHSTPSGSGASVTQKVAPTRNERKDMPSGSDRLGVWVYAGAGASPTDLDADFFFAVAVTTRFLPVRFAS